MNRRTGRALVASLIINGVCIAWLGGSDLVHPRPLPKRVEEAAALHPVSITVQNMPPQSSSSMKDKSKGQGGEDGASGSSGKGSSDDSASGKGTTGDSSSEASSIASGATQGSVRPEKVATGKSEKHSSLSDMRDASLESGSTGDWKAHNRNDANFHSRPYLTAQQYHAMVGQQAGKREASAPPGKGAESKLDAEIQREAGHGTRVAANESRGTPSTPQHGLPAENQAHGQRAAQAQPRPPGKANGLQLRNAMASARQTPSNSQQQSGGMTPRTGPQPRATTRSEQANRSGGQTGARANGNAQATGSPGGRAGERGSARSGARLASGNPSGAPNDPSASRGGRESNGAQASTGGQGPNGQAASNGSQAEGTGSKTPAAGSGSATGRTASATRSGNGSASNSTQGSVNGSSASPNASAAISGGATGSSTGSSNALNSLPNYGAGSGGGHSATWSASEGSHSGSGYHGSGMSNQFVETHVADPGGEASQSASTVFHLPSSDDDVRGLTPGVRVPQADRRIVVSFKPHEDAAPLGMDENPAPHFTPAPKDVGSLSQYGTVDWGKPDHGRNKKRPPGGDGTGLLGMYYTGNFQNLVFTRTDRDINYDWSGTGPGPLMPKTMFTVRWLGDLVPRYSDSYTIMTTSDDGVRVYLDDNLIISDWSIHAATEDIATVNLVAGHHYKLKVEYFEKNGYSYEVMKLCWESPQQPREYIPESCLRYPTNPVDTSQ